MQVIPNHADQKSERFIQHIVLHVGPLQTSFHVQWQYFPEYFLSIFLERHWFTLNGKPILLRTCLNHSYYYYLEGGTPSEIIGQIMASICFCMLGTINKKKLGNGPPLRGVQHLLIPRSRGPHCLHSPSLNPPTADFRV